jgi:hypothetical protein
MAAKPGQGLDPLQQPSARAEALKITHGHFGWAVKNLVDSATYPRPFWWDKYGHFGVKGHGHFGGESYSHLSSSLSYSCSPQSCGQTKQRAASLALRGKPSLLAGIFSSELATAVTQKFVEFFLEWSPKIEQLNLLLKAGH